MVSSGAGLLRRAQPAHRPRGRGADRARQQRRRLDASEIAEGGVDAIIVNASGCGTMVKDYGNLLAREPEYAERAADIAALASDITEFLDRLRHRRAETVVEPQGRLSRRLLAAARPAHHAASRKRS